MASPARRQLAFVEFTPEYADRLAAFYRKVWDPAATADSVLAGRARVVAANPAAADGRNETVLALLDDVVVGHFTSHPERVAFAGAVKRVAWTAGFHVLPEHRNGPLGVMLAKEMLRAAPHSMCTTVLDAPLRIFTALGWKHVGTVPNFVYVADPAAIAQRIQPERVGLRGPTARALTLLQRVGIAGATAGLSGLALRAWSATTSQARVTTRVFENIALWPGLAEADALWGRCAAGIAASLVRDAARLRWRFAQTPGRYVIIEARERSALVGWLVLRRPKHEGDDRLAGTRLAPLSDLLFPPDRMDVAASLILAATRYCREGFAQALLASTPHTGTARLLRRIGFLPMAGNLHLVVHPRVLPSPEPAFNEWWHARGDGDADQSF
jgi:hypothetical protein